MNKIKHTGIVDGVEGECVKVRILQASACSACKVAAHCNASADAASYQKGDSVVVVADASVGYRASLYGYLLPLVTMVATLIAVLATTHSEGMAAVSALGILVPYYVVLYLMRNRLRNRFSFKLERC